MKKIDFFKFLLAAMVTAVGAWAQNVWDGTTDLSWYKSLQNEFTITTAAQLAGLAKLVNDGNNMSGRTITLGADIMLNDTTDWKDWANTAPANKWTPIGIDSAKAFRGTFDGAEFVVSGVYINRIKPSYGSNAADDYQGLFSWIYVNATLKNLGVAASYVKGRSGVGVLAGRNFHGTIENCFATGNVIGWYEGAGVLVGRNDGFIENCYANGDIEGAAYVGGLAGFVLGGEIKNSYATGNVNGTSNVGGLAGSVASTIVKNCYATGNVTATSSYVGGLTGGQSFGLIDSCYATGDVKGTSYVGGLIGSSSGIKNSYAIGNVNGTSNIGGLAGSNAGIIENSYASGNVTGTVGKVGGLIGYNITTIENSYSTGNVEGNLAVGGLVGFNGPESGSGGIGGIIKNSYALGDVSGSNYIGGFIGMDNGGTTTNCYALGNVTGEIIADELVGESRGNGKFTNIYYKPNATQLAGIHSEWNFENIWALAANINDGYPYLFIRESEEGEEGGENGEGNTSIAKTAVNKAAASIGFAGITNGQINLNLKAGSYTAQLYNLQGRLVKSVDINATNGINATGLRIDNLSKGIFIFNVKQAGASVLKHKIAVK